MEKYSGEVLEQVQELAKPYYDNLKVWGHGWVHIFNVVKAASKLAKLEGVDPVLCQVAAYCHDLGRLEEERRGLVNSKPGAPSAHAVMSVQPTKKILDEVGITGQDAADIIEAAQIHNIRKYEGVNKIALILQDADRADGFGKIAILRFAVFNCEIEIPEPKDDADADRLLDEVRDVLKNNPQKRDRMIETLEYVFKWLDDLANTKSLKKYVEDGYKFNEEFYEEIKKY